MEKKTKKEVTKLFKGAEDGVNTVEGKKWFKISKRTSLLINKNAVDEAFIPKDIAYEDSKKTVEQVAIAIAHKLPVLLVGETGTGKTSLVRHLANKTKNAFVRVNHNGGTTIEDIAGRWIIDGSGQTVWMDGILIEAMKKGYWFLADEINAAGPEVNFIYHSLLDDDGRVLLAEKGNEVVIPHPNFRFFGAMNPPAEYAGTKELNKALLSRFMVVSVDFPAPKTEQKILVERTGIDADSAEKMVRFAGQIRITHSKNEISYTLSTRDMLMWAAMYKVFGKYMIAAEMAILNKVSNDDIEMVKDVMGLHFKSSDSATASQEQEEVELP